MNSLIETWNQVTKIPIQACICLQTWKRTVLHVCIKSTKMKSKSDESKSERNQRFWTFCIFYNAIRKHNSSPSTWNISGWAHEIVVRRFCHQHSDLCIWRIFTIDLLHLQVRHRRRAGLLQFGRRRRWCLLTRRGNPVWWKAVVVLRWCLCRIIRLFCGSRRIVRLRLFCLRGVVGVSCWTGWWLGKATGRVSPARSCDRSRKSRTTLGDAQRLIRLALLLCDLTRTNTTWHEDIEDELNEPDDHQEPLSNLKQNLY